MVTSIKKKRDFTSTIYHLWHGHQTPKDNTRFAIFHKHKAYSRDDWIDHIRRNHKWGVPNGNITLSKEDEIINDSLIYAHMNTNKPYITLCIVNYLRYDILLSSLKSLALHNVCINVLLWINDSNKMDRKVRDEIEKIHSTFAGGEIIYNEENMGTGYPRYMMMNKAYYEYKTEYIMTTDDDVFFRSPESLIIGATILDQEDYKDYGAVGLWCDPQVFVLTDDGPGSMQIERVEDKGFHDVNTLGAASMTVRRDVLKSCNCDPEYVIGFVDWDFSFAIRSAGWKLGMLCDNRFKPYNDTSENSPEYTKTNRKKSSKDDSKERFKKKWKIQINKRIETRVPKNQ